MSGSLRDLVRGTLEEKSVKLDIIDDSLDLYEILLNNKVLDENNYSIEVLENDLELAFDHLMSTKFTTLEKLDKATISRIRILEYKGVLVNIESYMVNPDYKYKAGRKYRVRGKLILMPTKEPFLGYGKIDRLLPPKYLGSSGLEWSPDKCIAPPYKLFKFPKPKSEEYYKKKFGIGFNRKILDNFKERRGELPPNLDRVYPLIKEECYKELISELNLQDQKFFKQLIEYSEYPVIQIYTHGNQFYGSVYQKVFDFLFSSWGTVDTPYEIELTSEYNQEKQPYLWVLVAQTKKDLYLDIPTLDAYI